MILKLGFTMRANLLKGNVVRFGFLDADSTLDEKNKIRMKVGEQQTSFSSGKISRKRLNRILVTRGWSVQPEGPNAPLNDQEEYSWKLTKTKLIGGENNVMLRWEIHHEFENTSKAGNFNDSAFSAYFRTGEGQKDQFMGENPFNINNEEDFPRQE